MKTNDLYKANMDVLCVMQNVHTIGWYSLKELSIQRIIYLSKVLYHFVNKSDINPYSSYHFTTAVTGPYSELINRSIIDLESNEYLQEKDNGDIILNKKDAPDLKAGNEEEWLKTIIYILGKYGEKRIFGFILRDPVYQESIESNSQKELDTSPDNKTIDILNSFKEAFEKTLEDVSAISSKEYLELYFDYVFSLIIK